MKYEKVYLKAYESMAHAKLRLGRGIDFYSQERQQQTLKTTPDQNYGIVAMRGKKPLKSSENNSYTTCSKIEVHFCHVCAGYTGTPGHRQVELFFKWIKQNLKIKSFIGTSKNAVMIQVWIAMCVYLILAFLKLQSATNKSMQ